jgi:hypothetical protein
LHNLSAITSVTAGVVLLVMPARLRWSRRSRRLLALSSFGLSGVPLFRWLCGWGAGVERANLALTGATLIGAQYLLSEEESSVRGAVATIGGLLVLFALPAPDEAVNEVGDA